MFLESLRLKRNDLSQATGGTNWCIWGRVRQGMGRVGVMGSRVGLMGRQN